MHVSDAVRADLEHRPKLKPADEDRPRRSPDAGGDAALAALAALQRDWASSYEVGIDGSGLWWALRRDGLPAVSGDSPAGLEAAILDDYAANPVRPR